MKFKSFYGYAGSFDSSVQSWLEKNHNIVLENVKVKKLDDRYVFMTIFYTEKKA